MTNDLLSQLDAIRKEHGCGSDQSGSTQRHAAKWSKQVLAGEKKLAGAVTVPAPTSTVPRNEPLLKVLKEKYKSRGFGWTVTNIERKAKDKVRVVKVLQLHNYPGADKGYMLTLVDLLILPAGEVDSYAEALCAARRRMPRKSKQRRGAGRFGAGLACNAW